MVFIYHASLSRTGFIMVLIPLYMYVIPLFLEKEIHIRFKLLDLVPGIIASISILVPSTAIIYYFADKPFQLPESPGFLFFQLLGVALPEEIYFRGFLQQGMNNNMRAIVVVSFLFAFIHIPQLLFYGQFLAPLTFFPSLIMGYLYTKTGNVVASTIFHFLSNVVFYGFFRG